MSNASQRERDTTAVGASAEDARGGFLRAEGISRTYRLGRVDVPVLRRADLSVRRGEFAAIMGKSGSGKSTLLHVLGALDEPQEGQVFVNGEPVYAPKERRSFRARALDVLSVHERRRNRLRRDTFGFVFQFYHLLPELTVFENVLVTEMVRTGVLRWPTARSGARRRVSAELERVGLSHRLAHRPSELSGGERQRVAIARALVHRPSVLLADEPTGNLDATSGAAILAIFQALHAEGQTIVMVTHDATVAACADRVLHLDDGQLAAK
ncbi:MAG: ABC transporter ATP-binding protein [Planctomycetia bacterium]|nr:MAG: ABC transporter ATP-binding protein [Planctomycetia bacterium]